MEHWAEGSEGAVSSSVHRLDPCPEACLELASDHGRNDRIHKVLTTVVNNAAKAGWMALGHGEDDLLPLVHPKQIPLPPSLPSVERGVADEPPAQPMQPA